MDWATQGRTTASIGAARRREDRLGKIPPQPSLFDQRNRGTPRNIQDRSRTHFKDLSTQHPGVPYFSDLAVKEKAYWDSGAWIPDAGLKQDTSIEETLFALTGVPSLARLGVSGAKAAVGSGRQALANRGIGGWTKVHPGSASARSRMAEITPAAKGKLKQQRYKNLEEAAWVSKVHLVDFESQWHLHNWLNRQSPIHKKIAESGSRADYSKLRDEYISNMDPEFQSWYTTKIPWRPPSRKPLTDRNFMQRDFERLQKASVEKTKTHLTGRVTDRQMDDLDLWTDVLDNLRKHRAAESMRSKIARRNRNRR